MRASTCTTAAVLLGLCALPELDAHAGELVYLNRNGGTYAPGIDNAQTNHSSLVSETAFVPAWQVSDQDWQQVVTCMEHLWAPFDVVITDADPGAVPHVEAVIAGRPDHIGSRPEVGGVAPFRSDCGAIRNAVVFAFAEAFGTDHRRVCEAAAQEVAHAFGVDHQYLCADPMTYLVGCGEKSFRNEYAPCGELSPTPCRCGGTAQNSVQRLLAHLGPADDRVFPDVRLRWPETGSVVGPEFSLDVVAEPTSGVVRVDLYIDDELVRAAEGPPFVLTAPDNLQPGEHTVRIVGRDADGNEGAASAIVELRAGGALGAPGEAGGDYRGVGCSAATGGGAPVPRFAAALLTWLALAARRGAAKRRRP